MSTIDTETTVSLELFDDVAAVRDDPQRLRAALAAHGSDQAVADAVGVARRTVLVWRHAHGIGPAGTRGVSVPDAAAALRDDPEAMRAALDIHGGDGAVAAAVGVSRAAVHKWRTGHGIDPAGTCGIHVSDAAAALRDDPDKMRAALARHGTDHKVAAAVGVARGTVLLWRQAHGIAAAGS